MSLTLSWERLTLPYEFPFGISRGTQTQAQTVLVRLSDPDTGRVGLGEAVPSAFYGETPDTVAGFYEARVADGTLAAIDPLNRQALHHVLSQWPAHRAARAGLEMAVLDLAGQTLGVPLYQLWGLDPARLPKTSYTLGLADRETVARKVDVAVERGYDVLKVKLGGADDWACLDLIRRRAPHATLRVDANAAWTFAEAVAALQRLESLGVEFVEEPLKLSVHRDDVLRLKASSPLPLMADERCHTLADVPRCAEGFHAINLKLTKTGGLEEAMRMVHAARSLSLGVMLGCFGETSVSITGLAHLAPLVDWADLDGSLLLAEDPFEGVTFAGSQMCMPTRPGLGVQPRA